MYMGMGSYTLTSSKETVDEIIRKKEKVNWNVILPTL